MLLLIRCSLMLISFFKEKLSSTESQQDTLQLWQEATVKLQMILYYCLTAANVSANRGEAKTNMLQISHAFLWLQL